MSYLQIESRHKEFFGLICYHTYYRDLLCTDFEFVPTPETVQQLRNYYLIFKPLPFGFLVTYSPDESPQRLKMAPPKMRLSFTIKALNKRFVNFTDIPFQADWQALHFSNLNARSVEIEKEVPKEVYYYFKQLNVADSQKKLLHLPQHQEVETKPRKFNFDVINEGISGEPVSYNDLKFYDEWGEEINPRNRALKKDIVDVRKVDIGRILDTERKKLLSKGLETEEIEKQLLVMKDTLAEQLASRKTRGHLVDLRHAPYGLYSVGTDNGFNKKTVYLSENPSERIFGMLDIHLDADNVNALLNREGTDEASIIKPQLYHFHFEARETFWRYYFMNHKGSRVQPKMIKEEFERLSFGSPQEGKLENLGTRAVVSISDQPIALRDRPEYVLFLERVIGKRAMKDLRLPVPNVDLIKPLKKDGEMRIYSDVYVYL